MANLESKDTHVSQDLAVLAHEQENAMDWLDLVGQASVGRPEEL